jgi:hypothetical protein
MKRQMRDCEQVAALMPKAKPSLEWLIAQGRIMTVCTVFSSSERETAGIRGWDPKLKAETCCEWLANSVKSRRTIL